MAIQPQLQLQKAAFVFKCCCWNTESAPIARKSMEIIDARFPPCCHTPNGSKNRLRVVPQLMHLDRPVLFSFFVWNTKSCVNILNQIKMYHIYILQILKIKKIIDSANIILIYVMINMFLILLFIKFDIQFAV